MLLISVSVFSSCLLSSLTGIFCLSYVPYDIMSLDLDLVDVLASHTVRVVDQDPDSITLWIRIRNTDPDPWARKMKKKMHFSFALFKHFL
jgi:hypothetical protein